MANRPRILIGGWASGVACRWWLATPTRAILSIFPTEARRCGHELEALRRACEAVGRNPQDVEVTLSSRLAPNQTSDEFANPCRAMADQGIDHVVLVGDGPWTDGALDTVADSIAGLNATFFPGR